jgi:HEAT repeat protein
LGDASVAPDLVALLAAPSAEVRAQAAAALGELNAVQAKPVLARMLDTEPDPDAAAQMAIAALRLGHLDARPAVVRALALEPHARLAAIALAQRGAPEGEAVLLQAAASSALLEPERIAALRALAELGAAKQLSRGALPAIARLLSEVRLREEVARTLGKLGDKRAVPLLRRALRKETYPEAREAQIEALTALGDRAAARYGKTPLR